MIRHILLITFKDTAEPSKIDELKRMFEAMPSKLPGILSVEWGVNNSPENLNNGFTHSVLMTFENEEVRKAYLPHPEHDALKAVFKPILENVIVFDYSVNK